MKAKEAEQLTGLSKQTLIWYEKEGLIHPERKENRYREYSDQDIKTLLLIKLLRGMDVSIDDIRQILEQHVSVEEILEEQKVYLEREEARLKDVEKSIRFYADTNAPLMDSLQKLHRPEPGFGGQEKPLKPFHIGTRPDRKTFGKLLFGNGLWLLGLGAVTVLFVCRFQHVWNMAVPPFFLPLLLAAVIVLGLFGAGIPQLGLSSVTDHYSQYVEFSRDGISYVRAETFREKLQFLGKIFRNQETLTCVPYDRIEKVTVIHDTKYVRAFLPIASELTVTSFIFQLQDGLSFSILHRMFYGNDEEIILQILREQVGQEQVQVRKGWGD